MAAGLILEGVAGSGKSRVLAALRADPDFQKGFGRGLVCEEDETFGEWLDELRGPDRSPEYRTRRLSVVIERIKARGEGRYLLERFHPSYYALLPDWTLYQEADDALARLGGLVVCLTIPEQDMRERFLLRRERADGGWREGLAAYFGSEEQAVQAAIESQRRRLECRALSRLPWILIDTADTNWPAHAKTIIDRWGAD